MIHQATQAIYDVLSQEKALPVSISEAGESSQVCIQLPVESGRSCTLRFISSDEDNDVAVRIYAFLSLTAEQRQRVLPALNYLNGKYRYVKFTCDRDGDVNLEYDYPVQAPSPAQSALEMLRRFSRMAADAYPILMKAVWGGKLED